jgi:hypothetical protein
MDHDVWISIYDGIEKNKKKTRIKKTMLDDREMRGQRSRMGKRIGKVVQSQRGKDAMSKGERAKAKVKSES